jgi:hypothetical protein
VRAVHRWVVLLALAGCQPTGAPEPAPVAATAWIVPPAPGGFPLGGVAGRLGRSQAPQLMVDLGLAAGPGLAGRGPLHQATVLAIPGEPARAVLFGADGERPAIEVVEIDRGRVVWRDAELCAAPVVGATAQAIVCADRNGTRAIGVDGKPRWRTAAPFIAFTQGRVAISRDGASIILDADSGDELARTTLPRGVSADTVIASCGDAGRELFAIGRDGRLVRVAEATGGPVLRWTVQLGAVTAIDACDGPTVVVTEAGQAGHALVAIARDTGKVTGRLDGVRGWWPARDGSDRLEVATARGVARYPRDLVGDGGVLALPRLGELLATRGELRLVRASPLTAVVLDRAGVRGYLPLAAGGAVLGDTALVATSWVGSAGEVAHRRALPPRLRRTLRLPGVARGVAVDAELRDLPPLVPLALAAAIAQPGTATHAVAAHAIDPRDGAALYAVAIDRPGEPAAVARADLAARRWRWQRVDGCGPGTPVGLAVARAVVVCAARGGGPDGGAASASVRATRLDGAPRWTWTTGNLDAVAAAGDVVVAHDADRITVLDARDGRVRGHVASDDGAPVRVALVVVDDTTLVVTAARGRVVAHLGIAGLLPVWSIAVAGVVQGLAPSGRGVLVALEDGDAFRIDARTAAVVALPGLGLAWHAVGDVVAGATVGGPIPGPPPPVPPLTAARMLGRPLQILRGEIDTPPPMSTPIAPPPPLGRSWQLTLYELAGGLRARNDYALAAPVAAPAPRGPAGSPLVVAHGPELRDVVVLDPRTGDPLRRVRLPDDAAPGAVFGTVVDGSPVAGTLLGAPLRVVVF